MPWRAAEDALAARQRRDRPASRCPKFATANPSSTTLPTLPALSNNVQLTCFNPRRGSPHYSSSPPRPFRHGMHVQRYEETQIPSLPTRQPRPSSIVHSESRHHAQAPRPPRSSTAASPPRLSRPNMSPRRSSKNTNKTDNGDARSSRYSLSNRQLLLSIKGDGKNEDDGMSYRMLGDVQYGRILQPTRLDIGERFYSERPRTEAERYSPPLLSREEFYSERQIREPFKTS